MAPRNALLGGALASLFLLSACGGEDAFVPAPQPTMLSTSFASGVDGWSGAFADYSTSTAPTDVVWEVRALPAPLTGTAYYTGGTNRSDDLFVYNKKKFTGFKPSANYTIVFEIEIATNLSSGCVGVGGSPGESVYVIAGAAPTEPKTVATSDEYRVNLDRGNQATAGKASQVLGNIANSVPNCGAQVYQSKVLTSTKPLTVQSDASGNIWVFFGIDSGFEAKSSVFYKSVKANVVPVA